MSSAYYLTPTQDKYRTAKWGYDNDQQMPSTYHKSPSINKSTQYGQRSQYKSYAVSRLQTAKKNIDQVISDISQKKHMNDQALRQVRSVNSQIIQEFRRHNAPYQRKDISKSAVSPVTLKSAQYLHYQDQDQQYSLRSRLNQQLRKNNQLMKRLNILERQNQQLKQNQLVSFRSTPKNIQLQAQNRRLKDQLANISMIPQQLFDEMEQLKRQNHHLRTDTVRLLKKVERF